MKVFGMTGTQLSALTIVAALAAKAEEIWESLPDEPSPEEFRQLNKPMALLYSALGEAKKELPHPEIPDVTTDSDWWNRVAETYRPQ